MFRIDVIDGVATMVRDAPVAPAPVESAMDVCVRPEDTIVLRLGKPLKVVFAEADAEAEMKLEVAEYEEENDDEEEIFTVPKVEDEDKHDEYMNNVSSAWANGTIPTVPFCDGEDSDDDEIRFQSAFADPLLYWGGLEKSVKDADGMVYHRHPNPKYVEYGCCFETGVIVRFKPRKNEVNNKLSVNLKNGITLSLGMENGKRQQKHYAPQKFVAEVALDHGVIKQKSIIHTQLKINTKCQSYTKRPHLKLYPAGCLTFEMTGEVKDGLPTDATGTQLRARVKTADQIDEFVASIRRENDKLKPKIESRDEEIKKLKEQLQEKNDEINKLKDEIERYSEHSNSPLKAGAIQLQELLMTEHQGSTVLEMLQFCFKDITRYYPKNDDYERDDADADLIFGLPECGLPDRNEIITR